jgi:nitrate/nitrite transporter NarK
MRYLVLTFLCLIAVIAYVQRLGVQTANTPIQHDFQINTEQFGTLGTALLLGYAILQVPTGWLADRLGSRNTLAILAILWSAIAGSIGLCRTFEGLLVSWFVMGMALAGIFPCAAKSIGAWFPDTEKATASGLLGSFTMAGTALASLLTSRLLTDAGWSWRWIYVCYGAAGVLWALAYFALIPERTSASPSPPAPLPQGERGDGSAATPPMTGRDWRRLATSAPLWLLCGQQFFRGGAMIFFINWFTKFLKEARSFGENDAGYYAACVNACALVGGIAGGFFSDAIQGIAVAGMLGAAGLVVATYFVELDALAITLFCIGAFIATFGGVSGYTVAIEFGGRRIGLVFSIMNMCGNFGAAIVNQAVGALKERTGSWNVALFVIAAVFVIDAVCWALLNPKGPLFEVEEPAPSS